MALQHLRSSTANKRPTPAGMSDGQLALNTNNTSPGLFFKDSNGALVKVGPVHVGTTAPNATPGSGGSSGNAIGEQWLDTTGGTYVFKVWDGSAWRSESGTFVDVNGDVMTGALGIIAGSAGSPGLYFSGDTNTGLYSPGADQVAISTGGSGRLFVDASGNVGVGATPSSWASIKAIQIQSCGLSNYSNTLTNNQTFLTNNAYYNGGWKYIYGDIAAMYEQRHQGGHAWYNASSGSAGSAITFNEAMRLDTSGRLGVGTSTDLTNTGWSAVAGGQMMVRGDNGIQIHSTSTNANTLVRLNFAHTSINSQGIGLWTSSIAGGNESAIDVTSGSTLGGYLSFYTKSGGSGTNSVPPAERVRIDSSGRVGVGTTSPFTLFHVKQGANRNILFTDNASYANNGIVATNDSGSEVAIALGGNPIQFITGATERARIDSSGRLLVGTSTSAGNAKLQVIGDSAANTNPGRFRVGTAYAASAFNGPTELGRVEFGPVDDVVAASISSWYDITGSGSVSDFPGRLVFSTTSDGASSPTERLRVTSDGYVRLSASSPGIQFGGDTAAANALDDYEEGTFTPTIVGTSTAGTATYGANGQQGRYTKIGNRVFFDLYLAWSAHTGTGDLQINGLPFTVQNTTNLNRTFSAIFSSLTLTAGSVGAAFSSPNTTTIALRQLPTGGGSVATVPMDTSAQISISGSFDV